MDKDSDEKRDENSSYDKDKKVGAEVLNSIVKKKILELVKKTEENRNKDKD